MKMKKNRKIPGAGVKDCWQDRCFNGVNNLLLLLVLICTAYPFIYIISCSFSSGDALLSGQIKLFPKEFSLIGYRTVFQYTPIWTGYLNSLIYMFSGTFISLVLVILMAYPLSRNDFVPRKWISGLLAFVMVFIPGTVPSYMLVKDLGLLNTRWAIILPGALSAYNVIVARTFFKNSIPNELLEASRLDGCDDFKFLWKIVLPLSKPIIAVLSLWVAVGLWNSYFNPMIYLNDPSKYPLQLVLRQILLMTSNLDMSNTSIDPILLQQREYLGQILKYGSIVVSAIPLMLFYPFVQKYFEKGVMIGSVKG